MNAKEIKSQTFNKSARGYRVDEVDTYLNQIAVAFDELFINNGELQNKLEILASKLEEYRQDENSMKEALLGAQKLGNSIVSEAKSKASDIVAEAQSKGDSIIKEATESSKKALEAMKKDIENERRSLYAIQHEVADFKAKLLALYKTHLSTITAIPEVKEESSAPVTAQAEPLSETAAEISVDVSEETNQAEPDASAENVSAASENAGVSEAQQDVTDKNDYPPIFSTRFGAPSGDAAHPSESKFADLRFGRNAANK